MSSRRDAALSAATAELTARASCWSARSAPVTFWNAVTTAFLCRANAEQFETLGSAELARVTREAPSRIPFLVKDPRGHAEFYAALGRHDARGSANTMRSFQGGRPSIYTIALFNAMVERFIALVEASRWGVRDPRSMMPG